jgi:esterase
MVEQFVAGTAITDPDAGAAGKLGLTANPSDELLARLVESTPEESAESSLQSLMSWIDGHPSGGAPSVVGAPVAVVVTDDQFFSEQVLRALVVPRFTDVRVLEVRDAGHFVHIEQPEALASRIHEFAVAL